MLEWLSVVFAMDEGPDVMDDQKQHETEVWRRILIPQEKITEDIKPQNLELI